MEALVPQLVTDQAALYIIDNGSTDPTKDLVYHFINKNFPVVYNYESRLGLSHARNKGWSESHYEWIFYIDDDCLPPLEFVSNAITLINQHIHFDAFGGPVDPVFISAPPSWLSPEFGSFAMPFDEVTKLEKGYIRGGCFLVKRQVLEKLGGFDTSLGMTGQQ
jgi:glycosyltransferase involved in cell wall biosynthesis